MVLSRFYLVLALCGLAVGVQGQGTPALTVDDYARSFRAQLAQTIMPYWFDTTVDREHGGYILSDDPSRPGRSAAEKQLVTQARMIWGFSHVLNHQLAGGARDYLQAARQGYEFLERYFHDPVHGGYYWTVGLRGQPLVTRKIVYGQSFVIYALVEYYRASGDRQALERARELWTILQVRAHDPKHGGWNEHFERNWQPLPFGSTDAQVEVAGYKSANTHLHLMEALTELYTATGDKRVKGALREALKLNQRYFYPERPGQARFHFRPDWRPVTDPGSEGLSFGHNVEFAWLMIRAQRALGRRPDWTHFFAYVDHALEYGWDAARGGLYQLGRDDQPAWQTDKAWWPQAEMLVALIDARAARPRRAEYDCALRQLLAFIAQYQTDPKDGVWFDTVAADGAVKKPAKAHNWKANYHDVRALVRLVESAGAGRGR